MKKYGVLSLIFVIFILLVSCNKEETIETVDFSNMFVDLSESVSLGISIKEDNKELNGNSSINLFNNMQGVSAENIGGQPVLTMIDENGDYSEVIYFNENEEEIDMPYYLISLDIIGDFVFLAYVNEYMFENECRSDINLCEFNQNYREEEFGVIGIFGLLDLALNVVQDGGPDELRFIMIEKNSGKVFDLAEIYFDILDTDSDGVSNYEMWTYVYVYDDLIYFNAYSWSGPLTIMDFNDETQNLDIETFIPSAIGVRYLFRTPKGTTFMIIDDEYSFLKSDNITFGSIDDYFETHNEFSINSFEGFIVYEDKIVYIIDLESGGLILTTNYDDEIIDAFSIPTVGGGLTAIKLSEDLILIGDLLIDISELESTMLDIGYSYEYFKSANNIVILSEDNLFLIDYISKEVSLIDENINLEDDSNIYYVTYSVNVGISKVYKKFIYSTGEIIVGEYVPPTTEVFSVQPLN